MIRRLLLTLALMIVASTCAVERPDLISPEAADALTVARAHLEALKAISGGFPPNVEDADTWTYLDARLPKLIRDFQNLCALHPDDHKAWHGLAIAMGYGYFLEYEGIWERAEQAFEMAIYLDPEDAGLHRDYGMFCLNTNRVDRAIPLLAAAIDLDGEGQYRKTLLDLSIAYRYKERIDLAMAAVRAYLKDFPEDEHALELMEIYRKKRISTLVPGDGG